MIQFNLLPDVKVEFVKAQRTKRLVVGVALIATASSFVIFLLLFIAVNGVQKKSLSDVDGDIKQYSSELKSTTDLNKILTIQSQLGSLNKLHPAKFVSSRIFNIMQQTTPADVTISTDSVDFTANTMTITGAAQSLDRVNTFVDTLKFTSFVHKDNTQSKAFSDVVLAQFGRDDKGSSYTITLNVDPMLFSSSEDGTVIVPKTVTTRSVLNQPTDIFKKATTSNNATNAQ
jgi:Tfp pilus assembly protein PilN